MNKYYDDTDEEWNARSYSMDSFYHQYYRFEDYQKTKNISKGVVNTFIIESYKIDSKKLLYITGSSGNHFLVNLAMILQLLTIDISASIVFVDFGLTIAQIKLLFQLFNNIYNLRDDYYHGEFYYRAINWRLNPVFLRKFSKQSIYALKAIALVNVVEECHCTSFWLDAGDFVYQNFPKLYYDVRKNGIKSAISPGRMTKYIHRGMYSFFNSKIPQLTYDKNMCSGGFVGLDYHNKNGFSTVGRTVRECCFRERCIFPNGSDLSNHRYDQSAWTLVAHAYNISNVCDKLPENTASFQHDSVHKLDKFSSFIQEKALLIEYTYNISGFSQNITKLIDSLLLLKK